MSASEPAGDLGAQENPPLTFSISEAHVGDRLDAFLASQIEGWSRSRLHRVIADGDVLVNGRIAKPSHKLRAKDEIEVDLTVPTAAAFEPEDLPVDVIYEDEDLIVVNKPAGQVVHPGAGVESGTLANALAFHFQQLSSRGGSARPGIVHRLDKDTSGLLVVAKTEGVHEHLSDQFRDREIFKSYLALVHGQVESEAGKIDQPIARDPSNRTRMAVVRTGRPAISLYQVHKRYDRFTLLDVEPKTGRTHQIRVHLSWLKHPVVGDALYGGGRDKTVANPQTRARIAKLGRHFLHAEQLAFRHPRTGDRLRFKASLPIELASLLESL